MPSTFTNPGLTFVDTYIHAISDSVAEPINESNSILDINSSILSRSSPITAFIIFPAFVSGRAKDGVALSRESPYILVHDGNLERTLLAWSDITGTAISSICV